MKTSASSVALALCLCSPQFGNAQTQGRTQTTNTTSHTLLVLADVNCALSIDGEPPRQLPSGKPTKVPIEVGEHILICETPRGSKVTQQINVSKSDPGQVVVKFALAGQIAA